MVVDALDAVAPGGAACVEAEELTETDALEEGAVSCSLELSREEHATRKAEMSNNCENRLLCKEVVTRHLGSCVE